MDPESAHTLIGNLRRSVSGVLLGKAEAVDLSLASFLAGGHLLLEDIPGTGKTTLARGLSAAIAGSFRRIQFTSDLLPQDIMGVHIFDADRKDFVFAPGPLFANVVLADEINRSNPRAQSALLEAMSERQVTVDAKTYPLPDPFFVIATQNPHERYGTYPLPESQLDRFNMRLRLSYPDRPSELRLIRDESLLTSRDGIPPVLRAEEVRAIREVVGRVAVRESVIAYIFDIVDGTRRHPAIRIGVSPRGAIGLKATAQALAFLRDRDFVIPDDVRAAAPSVLSHRIFLKGTPGGAGATEGPEAIVSEILDLLPSPA